MNIEIDAYFNNAEDYFSLVKQGLCKDYISFKKEAIDINMIYKYEDSCVQFISKIEKGDIEDMMYF